MSTGTERTIPQDLQGEPENETYWLLKKVWKRVNENNEHFMGCVVGREGSGKSYTAIKIANMLDESFNADRVIYDVIDMLDILSEGDHEPGNFYVLDEAGVQLGNRTWQERSQILANQCLQLIRSHNLGLIFTLPRGKELDEQAYARQQALMEMVDKEVDEYVRLTWQWIDPDRKRRDGKIYFHNPKRRVDGVKKTIKTIAFTPPECTDLIETYEAEKTEFQMETYKQTIKEARGETKEDEEDDTMSPREFATEIANGSVGRFVSRHNQTKQPYINQELIRAEYEVSHSDARAIKSMLEQQYTDNELEQYV